MFSEMRKLKTNVNKEMGELRAEIKRVGPRIKQGMEPAILAAKRELDKEAQIEGEDAWAKNAKKSYLQNPGIFENEIRDLSSRETENMEKELSTRADWVKSNLFWAKINRAAAFSVFTIASAFSSATYLHAANAEKMLPFQQKATFAIAALAAVCTVACIWAVKKSVEMAYESALEQIIATREWMDKKASEALSSIAEKIEAHKEWWLKSFSGQKQH